MLSFTNYKQALCIGQKDNYSIELEKLLKDPTNLEKYKKNKVYFIVIITELFNFACIH